MMSAKRTSTGTFRSSQRFGKKPRSGLEVTRIVRNARFTSFQNRYITSCSRNPVNRNVEKSARSHSSQAVKNLASSSSVYSRGSGEILSGSCRSLFPIVGIGASAGGLAAFEAFFSTMPPDRDPGMAFVLVQHLARDHKSILSELIRRYTKMQVFEVEDGMVIKPNCAYIIPPNRDMALVNGALQLLEPTLARGIRLPIDFFFRSLAQDQHDRAICIVLSGTGSDGALGVRAVKGEGGMVMAQTPESTEYDGMPRSAIATGMVDFVLPPNEMPAKLLAYVATRLGLPPSGLLAGSHSNLTGWRKSFSCSAPRPVMTFPNTNGAPSCAASSGVWPSTRSMGWKTISAICSSPGAKRTRSFANS
jgi:chemotaxis response regulator CheB